MGSVNATSSENNFVTSVRLTGAEHKALKEIAKQDKRSLSNELRYLIERRAEELAAPDDELRLAS